MAVPAQPLFAGAPNLALASAASITSTDEQAGFGIERVEDTSMYRRVKSVGASADWRVTVNAGAAISPRALVLFGTNLTDSATVEWEQDDNSGFLTPTSHGVETPFGSLLDTLGVDFVPDFGRHAIKILATDPTAEQYWRSTINDTSNPDGEYQVAHVMLSEIVVPEINPVMVDVQVVPGPQTALDVPTRQIRIDYSLLDPSERSALHNLAMKFGRTGRFLFAMRPTVTSAYVHEAFLVELDSGVGGRHQGGGSKFISSALTLNEVAT